MFIYVHKNIKRFKRLWFILRVEFEQRKYRWENQRFSTKTVIFFTEVTARWILDAKRTGSIVS